MQVRSNARQRFSIKKNNRKGCENRGLKIVSWNLLHTTGAIAKDIAAVIKNEKPDLFLMQEATPVIDLLPTFVGGHCYHQPWPKKSHNLAVWTAEGLEANRALKLPRSRMPGALPQRMSQLIVVDGITIANVHLSHGQILNRMQLRRIARSTVGPTAIIGDYNALGPIMLKGFDDLGPRGSTHQAQDILPFRLDRCMVRDLCCDNARVLSRGVSDHKAISMTLCIDKL